MPWSSGALVRTIRDALARVVVAPFTRFLLVCAAALPAHAGPQLDYTLNCMGCHGADGLGAPPEIPRLKDRMGYYLDVDGGRSYLVQVPGARQSALSNDALAGVLNWMLDRFAGASKPAHFEPYAADEVAHLRATPPNDVAAVRRDLERAIAAQHPRGYSD